MRGRHPAPGSCRTVLAAVAAREMPPAVNVSNVTKEPGVNPQAGGEQGGERRGAGGAVGSPLASLVGCPHLCGVTGFSPLRLCPFLRPLPTQNRGAPRGAAGPAGWGPAPISQGMGVGCREGDSKGGNKCPLLPKGEWLQLAPGHGGTGESRVWPRWGARARGNHGGDVGFAARDYGVPDRTLRGHRTQLRGYEGHGEMGLAQERTTWVMGVPGGTGVSGRD